MSNFAIIVAAGTGQRMNHSLPKQFHVLNEIPVLMRTLHAFHRSSSQPEIVLVLAKEWTDYWMDLCYQYQFHVPHSVVEGGESRFQSVKNGLTYIRDERGQDANLSTSVIAVHDGARPLVTSSLIDLSYTSALEHGAVAPGVSCTDSVRMTDLEARKNHALSRDQVYLIQTPQTFRADLLIEAYKQEEIPAFTDDCSVIESAGIPISLIPGERTNIKITNASDLLVANAFLQD